MRYISTSSDRTCSRLLASTTIAVSVLLCVACGGGVDGSDQWVASWHAAQQNYNEVALAPPPALNVSNETVRQIVHTSVGGNSLRLRLSNLFGTSSVTFNAVHVAKSAGNGAIVAGTDQTVTFGSETSVTVAAGTEIWSDRIALPIPTQSDLAVSLFIGDSAAVATSHTEALQTNYEAAGNQTASASLSGSSTFESYYWLSGVDVARIGGTKVMVAFGDSITDGYHSTTDANHRWPNFLDDRVQAAGSPTGPMSVVNSGIGGNRWLHDITGPNGIGRFARDVTDISGVTHVAILLGINDIGYGIYAPQQTVTGAQIIGAIQIAVAQAKAKGLKVYVGTLLPFKGAVYYSDAGETSRQAVNAYIRSASGIDGVIDFDKALQDPSDPASLLPVYDSGDHLHPDDAGYQVMGGLVNLNSLN
ncbi:SGNH/GDSL hydrolase family protein [Paraburkholderia metrosideri]|uniref:SGNH/GDSL hydrolase family protein n=1 Tax=Paraburkholderia metrosideri TaxID=580937 RepID=A0ABW9DYU6_9BURK